MALAWKSNNALSLLGALRSRQIRTSARLFTALSRRSVGAALIRLCRRSSLGTGILDSVLGYHKVYPTLAQAEAAISRFSRQGHETPYNADLHLRLNRKARPSDYAVLFHLHPLLNERVSVFDFGGNVGNIFYCYRDYVAMDGVAWTVFDLPANLARGEKLARDRKAIGLRFSNQWCEASGADILLASGSMHYFERPLPSLLDDLQDTPTHVFINRTPVTQERSGAVVQDAGVFQVACYLYCRDDIVRGFQDRGYELVDEWETPELRLDVPGHPDHAVTAYSGFYFRKQPNGLRTSERQD